LFNRNNSSPISSTVDGKKTVESLSISSMDEADIMGKGEESDDVSDGYEMEQDIAHTSIQPSYHSQDPRPYIEMKQNTSSGVSQVS
jgi:hypothetical protein